MDYSEGYLIPKFINLQMHLEGLAHKFTIFGTIVAVCLFAVAIVELYHFNDLLNETQRSTGSLDQLLNKTDSLLAETQKSTTGLTLLVNKTDQLIQIQNHTASNISQQTILKEYADGAPFKVNMLYCNYDASNYEIAYSPEILDKNGNPTSLQFMLIRFFGYYSTSTNNGNPMPVNKTSIEYDENPELIDPNGDNLYKLPLLTVLNQTKNLNNTYLFIRSEYYYAPYSETTGHLITKYVYDKTGQQMIEFKKDTTGNWELYTNQNSVCK